MICLAAAFLSASWTVHWICTSRAPVTSRQGLVLVRVDIHLEHAKARTLRLDPVVFSTERTFRRHAGWAERQLSLRGRASTGWAVAGDQIKKRVR